FANVDIGAWTRSVTVDAYNKMQTDVAREVKAGRRDEALGYLHRFKAETSALNAKLQSPPVAKQLHMVGELEDKVAAAFVGADQGVRQDALSKDASAQAIDARRAGNK